MSDPIPADELEAEFAELRDDIALELFADTFTILAPVEVENDLAQKQITYSPDGTVRGLLTARQVQRGEGISGPVTLTQTVYTVLLPYDLAITTSHKLELGDTGRVFEITDLNRTGAVGGPLVATVQESSR